MACLFTAIVMMNARAIADLSPGTRLGRYELGEPLGVGGMGTVYAAQDSQGLREVAVKVLHAGLARDADVRQRFLREARAVQRIEHRHCVRVFEVSEVAAERPFIVMESLHGEDLRALLDRVGPLSPRQACSILLPVAQAVAHAHARGVVHRDLKPENVFLAQCEDGSVVPKVLDFGVSKLLDEISFTFETTLLGTPSYMAPEQIEGAAKCSRASDQYALGVILYEALVGEPPFVGSSLYAILRAISRAEFTRPARRVASIDPHLEAVILRAMAKEPEARYPSVSEFALDLALVGGFASASTRACTRAQREQAPTLLGPVGRYVPVA